MSGIYLSVLWCSCSEHVPQFKEPPPLVVLLLSNLLQLHAQVRDVHAEMFDRLQPVLKVVRLCVIVLHQVLKKLYAFLSLYFVELYQVLKQCKNHC